METRLAAEITKVLSKGENLNYDRITKLEVHLNSAGELKGLKVIGSSGFEELDRAATDAFQNAAPFPNPPAGMIQGSELMPIRWDFVVINQPQGIQVKVRQGI